MTRACGSTSVSGLDPDGGFSAHDGDARCPRRSWPTAWVSSGAIRRRTASSTAAGEPGSRNTSALAHDARVGARQHRRRADLLERQHAEQLAEPGQAAVEQRAHRLRRAIARRDTGAAGHDDDVALARQPRDRVAQRRRLLGEKAVGRHREPRLLDQPAQHLAAFVGVGRAAVGRGHQRHAHRRGGRGERLVVSDRRGRGHDDAAPDQRTRSPATRPATPAPARPSDAGPQPRAASRPAHQASVNPVIVGGSISVT